MTPDGIHLDRFSAYRRYIWKEDWRGQIVKGNSVGAEDVGSLLQTGRICHVEVLDHIQF